MASSPIKTALVGCGTVSGIHASYLANHRDLFEVVACADISEQRAREFATKFSIPGVYEDYHALFQKEKPELVIFGTWPNQHEEQVLAAVEAGVPNILCEKSLAMNQASAARMAAAVRKAGTLLVEGFMWRHHPRVLEAQRLLAEGRIGNLRKVRAGFQRAAIADTAGSWKHNPERGGGVVFDFSCYCVNAMGAFLPDLPERVQAVWQRTPEGLVTDLHGLLEYPGGALGVIESSYTYSFQQILELHGDDGILRIQNVFTPGLASGIELKSGSKGREFEMIPAPAARPHEQQLLHLAECIRKGTAPRFTVEESVRNHSVIDALLLAAECGRAVTPQQA